MSKKILVIIFKKLRILGIAFMLAIANVYKGELRTIDDTTDKIEHVEVNREDYRV